MTAEEGRRFPSKEPQSDVGMSSSKNQHYNPKLILRQFSNDAEHIWICNSDGISYRNIKTVFKAKHLYTRKYIDTTNKASKSASPKTFEQSIHKDYRYDAMIGEIESTAAPVLQRVIERARTRECPRLSSEETDVLKRFILLTARRTPESQARIRANTDGLFYRVLKSIADDQCFPLPDKDELSKNQVIARIENFVLSNADARFAAGDMVPQMQDQYDAFFRDTGIQVLLCKDRRRFITGSHGLSIVTVHNGYRFCRTSVLPIAPDVAVAPTTQPDQEMLVLLLDHYVKAINIACAEQSHTIAGLTKEDVADYEQYVRTS